MLRCGLNDFLTLKAIISKEAELSLAILHDTLDLVDIGALVLREIPREIPREILGASKQTIHLRQAPIKHTPEPRTPKPGPIWKISDLTFSKKPELDSRIFAIFLHLEL